MSTLDAIYARQSVDKADSLSIQGQIDLCKNQASDKVKVYQDKGYSGKNTNRPAFQRMIEDVEKGLIRKIVVYRLDRFSRSLADFSRLWEILQKHRVEFVSINETFDTSTPMGRAMLSIIMVFAQLERETTAERVRDNYYQRAALGFWPGGPAPYGFSLGRLPCANGKLMPALIANEQADSVARIFRAYAEPESSLGSVARTLNADGIPAPKRATWDNVTLSRLLHSPLYVMANEDVFLYYKGKGMIFANTLDAFDGLHGGMVVGKRSRTVNKYNDLKNQHFSVANHFGFIPSDLWLQCQYKLDTNRQLGQSGKGKYTWLSGLMKCASCGYSIKVNRIKDKYYMVCSGRSNLGLCDVSIRVDLRALEVSVEQELEQLLDECPDTPRENMENHELLDELALVEQKIDRLISALAESSDLSMPYINRTIERLEQERQGLLRQQGKQHQCLRSNMGHLRFSALTFAQKKLVATQFIKEIKLADSNAEVIWNV
ncbi:MAG: recombinase family protein [Intestinimonas sp.]|nr:recombinase family protein [Intestinimonas sp.]